jgi:hypothetical protein
VGCGFGEGQGSPTMSAEQVVNGILINHIDEHCNSIRATIGR